MTVPQNVQEYARLRFMNVYEDEVQEWTTEKGKIINLHNNKGTLNGSSFYSDLYKVATELAKRLSTQRLEIDVEALHTFGSQVKGNEEWLKSNQRNLLLDSFWNQFILNEYRKPVFNGTSIGAENALLEKLQHLFYQAEREIRVLSIEPDSIPNPAFGKPQTIVNANSPGVQVNIAQDQATINASQTVNDAQIIEAVLKLVSLLKMADIPHDFKEETIDLAETVAEQTKNGKKGKGVFRALGEKLKLLKPAITGTDEVIKASEDLIQHANHLGELIKPIIS